MRPRKQAISIVPEDFCLSSVEADSRAPTNTHRASAIVSALGVPAFAVETKTTNAKTAARQQRGALAHELRSSLDAHHPLSPNT